MTCTNPIYAVQFLDCDGLAFKELPIPSHSGVVFLEQDRIRDFYNGNVRFYLEDNRQYYQSYGLFRPVPLYLPCGKCAACRLDYARKWSYRGLMEHWTTEHSGFNSAFITLTYDEAHLPSQGSLRLKDLQDFFKRLRGYIAPLHFRYLACGEYGTQTMRPHYHFISFGWSPGDSCYEVENHYMPDVETVNALGDRVYISPLLDRLWPFGHCVFGTASPESIGYVAGYVSKKQDFMEKNRDYLVYSNLSPPFITMSRRPGLGSDFFKKFRTDFRNGTCHLNDKTVPLPRLFLDKLKILDPDHYQDIMSSRNDIISLTWENDFSSDRLIQRSELFDLRMKKFERNL